MTTFPTSTYPTLPLLDLSDSERQLIKTLQSRASFGRAAMELAEAYYLGEQVIQNLRIAVPKELEFIRTIVGWTTSAVDPYVELLQTDCFRKAGAPDGDDHLAELMAANGFDAEQLLAFTDALSMGRSYWMVGSPDEKGGAPRVTVESPLNMSVLWDLRGTEPRAAMSEYRGEDNVLRGALVLPKQTIQLATGDDGAWVVVDRDQHDFDFVPVVRMAHKPRTSNRDGSSAITPAMRSHVDAACRTLLGIEVAREIYSVPQMLILGAAESAFQKADGTQKTAWETYVNTVLALERDEEGNLPEIKQKTTYDPSTFTKILDWHASAMAGLVAATPQDLGLYTDGNPASADAVIALESRRSRRAKNMWGMFGVPLVKVAQMALRFENKGALPTEYERLSLDWDPVTMDNPVGIADAVGKQVAAGSVPPTSDVVLKRLGYNAVDRARLAQDRKLEDGRQTGRMIAEALIGKGNAQQPQNGPAGGNGPAGL